MLAGGPRSKSVMDYQYQDSPGHVVFRSKSPGPGEYQNLLLHSGVLIPGPATSQSSSSSQSSQRPSYPSVVPLKSPCAEQRIVSNLRYSLDQLKLSSDAEEYRKLVDSVVVGPALVKQQDLSEVLGINQEFIARSRQTRLNIIQSGAQPDWTEKEKERENPGLRSQSVPVQGRRAGRSRRDLRERMGGPGLRSGLRSGLERQFQQVCRFGGCEGRMITLTESDKWMRVGKLLDNWNVTTMDTALAFRFNAVIPQSLFSFLILGRFQEEPSGWIIKNGGNFWMN